MSEPDAVTLMRRDASRAAGLPWQHAAWLGARIATRLRADKGDDPAWERVLGFLDRQAAEADAAATTAVPPQPLDALVSTLDLDDDSRTLLLLSLLPESHEGYGAALAALHPRGESRPTWGLFAWLTATEPGRAASLQLLHDGTLVRLGLVRLQGDAPLPERSLRAAEGLWGALHGLAGWPVGLAPLPTNPWLADLDDWLALPAVGQALAWLREPDGAADEPPPAILLRGLQPAALRLRAQQLAAASGGQVFEWDAALDAAALSALLAQLLARGTGPLVLLLDAPLPAAHWALLDACPLPLVLAGASAGQAARSARALRTLEATPLAPVAQARLWARALPPLAEHAAMLTARYPVGPETLVHLRRDLAPWLERDQAPPLERCVAALKDRMSRAEESFARRIQPQADWADLVLPAERLAPLQDAVARMRWQQRVLDDWGFGGHGSQRGPRGLRLLFSGLPGTGKTLAAEVVAHALHADLLVVDLARLVSKWIGETEKNLAAAFDQAEGTGAVLFFDEADALFGKRTEVSDAHDRYANIESAYLLARLERFDGVAILATNLRGNLDRAFLRRFEVAVDFAEPGPAERLAIWRRQFPAAAPLAGDVDLEQLAALHPLPGALIRNAALGAAFHAAAGGGPISRANVDHALRQEYDKSGRVNPL